MHPTLRLSLVLALLSLAFTASADNLEEGNWGIAIGYRIADIPYPAKDGHVDDFIPLLFYDSDLFFVRGLTGGANLYREGPWQFSLLGRYRYLDIPEEYQNSH